MGLRGLVWWIDRWRQSTAYSDMTLEEQGAYRNLLDEAHLRGGYLPDDERILARACGDALAWSRVREKILDKFTKSELGYHNKTLGLVLKESERRADKQRRYRERLSNDKRNGSGNDDGNDRYVVTRDQDQDQDQDQEANSIGVRNQQELAAEKKEKAAPPALSVREQNYRIITKIAFEVISKNGKQSGPDKLDEIKALCARRHIAYDSEIVRRALDTAERARHQ